MTAEEDIEPPRAGMWYCGVAGGRAPHLGRYYFRIDLERGDGATMRWIASSKDPFGPRGHQLEVGDRLQIVSAQIDKTEDGAIQIRDVRTWQFLTE